MRLVLFFLELCGLLLSVTYLSSVGAIILRIHQTRDPAGIEFFTLWSNVLSFSLWSIYQYTSQTFLRNQFLITFCSLLASFAFIFVFALHFPDKRHVQRWTTYLCGIYALIYYSMLSSDPDLFSKWMGRLCILMSVTSLGSPLVSVGQVLREKSSASLPLYPITANTLSCVVWMLYGWLVEDFACFVSSASGVFLGVIQLALIARFPVKNKQK